MQNIRIEGTDELRRNIETLKREVGSEQTERVLLDAAKIVTSKVKENIGRLGKVTGNLSRSPVTKKLPRKHFDQPRPAISAIDRKVAPHAHLLEFGTSRMGPKGFFRSAVNSTHRAVLAHVRNEVSRVIMRSANRGVR